MRFFNDACAIVFMFFSFIIHAHNNIIVINKKNVEYAFAPFDQATYNFVKGVLAHWQTEKFELFDQVKDPRGIAIDLGAKIGTTTVWLSKNFSDVIALDADELSLQCLENNVKASQCFNVTICKRPITQTSKGPVKGITFKQLIHDFVYANDVMKNKKISFINCDIEDGEEEIIEDVLYFAYYNNVKVYMSFHVDWWKTKKITDIEYLFKFFKTNCPSSDIGTFIKENPFASILFEPLKNAGTLIKKNMPVVIIGYNLASYIKAMVSQLEKYTSDIIVVDNNSSFAPLLDYYTHDFKYTLLRQNINHGFNVVLQDFVQNLVGDVYVLTDPDLKFNRNLPDNFIEVLLEISNYFKAYKVGFALDIQSDQIRTDAFVTSYSNGIYCNHYIKQWESQFWKKRLQYPIHSSLELYEADIDTTFCLINKKLTGSHIRVAGDYTCLHLPWFKDFKDYLMPGEYECYLKNNISSFWFK